MRLSELQLRIKQHLSSQFPLPIWIVAEISELKVNYSGHCYLELIEKGASDGVPKAQARAVIWRSHYPRIASYFESTTGQRLEAGMQLLVKATVSYHELYGFSLQISDIDASYTLGEMERKRQETIARLKAEGVWEMNQTLPLPLVVQRIAILSSSKAAGYQDFYQELSQSPYRFHTDLFEAVMQGEAAESSLISALGEVAERIDDYDVVVIIRGGGSTSDLNCFNSYRLCSHIAQFPLPILTGIGHDKDQSVADLVAHTALKTPTAVAGWLVDRMQQIEGWLDGAALTLHDASLNLTRNHLLRLERNEEEIKNLSRRLIDLQRSRLEQYALRLPEECGRLLRREGERIRHLESLTESHSPSRILRLGFSVTRLAGRAIRTAEEAPTGSTLEIELAEGHITATTK
jgi:exodeoxyribonuclease VII large subunit